MTSTSANEVDLELGNVPPISRTDPVLRTRSGDDQERERTDVGSVYASVGSATAPPAAHNPSRS
jgi:hypothetical protein